MTMNSASSKRQKLEEEKKSEDYTYGNQKYPLDTVIVKQFKVGGKLQDFQGTVKAFDADNGWYRVVYEDGDKEDFEEEELARWLDASEEESSELSDSSSPPKETGKRKQSTKTKPKERSDTGDENDSELSDAPPKKKAALGRRSEDIEHEENNDVRTTEGPRARRSRKAVNYVEDDESDDDSEPRKPKPKSKGRGSPQVDDSDDYSVSLSEPMSSSDEEDFDTESEPESEAKVLVRRKAKGGKKPTAKKATVADKDTEGNAKRAGKKKMCESFAPINAPLYSKLSMKEIRNTKEFLDPCGMEGTDDIVDRLVGEQVDKIASLLELSLRNGGLGNDCNPLQVGTACSGTDAPVLALALVREQMERRGLDNILVYEHQFSCENDPFKQAYLERNFDSTLYPDITKLSEEMPLDVYGQEKKIPKFNMFVAGTSCKNFSTLRSNRRIDIEDKGCSGETFLSAVEVLFKEKPQTAIFENVIGAPWAKMQEYITGRVKLSDCASSKAVKEIKDRNKELTFVLDENGSIVVDQVPAVYGVRAGAVVKGFLRPGEVKLNPIKMNPGKCTLSALLKYNKISKDNDTLVFETECTYCTDIVKVDSKHFGLPQTRERTYMFVWQPDDNDVNDDLGYYWKEIVQYLKSPVRHSLQSFILLDDHDIIRVFREALRGPPGRQMARGAMQEPDFWKSASANLPHNKNVREKLGMKDEARFITNWEGYGKRQVPPQYWLEYIACNEQRQVDLIDILHASALRDAEVHDSNFASFSWNTSQNASKEKHRTAVPGIASCISPGGEFFIPHLGRPLLGCEKLMIQGIPYFRLALGNETEVQLGDLAGNAMSLTVVCATMLAALTCKQLRAETLTKEHQDLQKVLSDIACRDGYNEISSWNEVGGRPRTLSQVSTTAADEFFLQLASLASDAIKSSVWCTCETSGCNSLATQFLQCKVCRISCCRNCVSTTVGYNLKSHETEDVEISAEDHCLGKFLSKLRQIVPPTLVFGSEGIDEIAKLTNDEHRVATLSTFVFGLHRITRLRRKWILTYYARDNHGIGEAIAEFRIAVGELRCDIGSAEDNQDEIGMKGELTSFFPARTTPLVYGPLDSCATVTVLEGCNEIQWNVRARDDESLTFCLVGEGVTDSSRIEAGLTDVAEQSLIAATEMSSNTKSFKAARARGEERRWLYPKKWKQWPEKIHLKVVAGSSDGFRGSADFFSGIFERARCRQTTNQSALWIKRSDKDTRSMYILMKPNVNRTGPDTAILSLSLAYEDSSSVLAIFPWDWEPSDALDPATHEVTGVRVMKWDPVDVDCRIPVSEIEVRSPRDSSDVLLSVSGLSETDVTMFLRESSTKENDVKLNVVGGLGAQQTVRVFNSVCVASILQYAAASGLKYDLKPDAPWMSISPKDPTVPFGCCQATLPLRPTEGWFFDKDREIWDRRSEPGASRNFYLALEAAPQPFELWLDRRSRKLAVKCFPEVVAHRAAGHLIHGRGGDGSTIQNEVDVVFRLSDLTQQSDPVVSPFKVSNCDSEGATFVELSGPYKLYERQQKVVSKMLAIEDQKTNFEELELSEQEMPGSSGLSLIAKASRTRKLCGGVIADAIGSGKTVVSIALILRGLADARRSRKFPNKSGATLVVVPPGLIDQWGSEIDKFTSGLEVIKVYDFNSLKKRTVKDIIEADVIIIPVNILEANGYMQRVVQASNLSIKDADIPKLPQYTGQIEQTSARGVWIPSSSTDPYNGGNNPLNQKRRNESAYYTHVYLSAVISLRENVYKPSDKGVPLEFFEFERLFVDEIHESLCTTKVEMKLARETEKESNAGDASGFFTEKNRRCGRELLGLTEKDIRRRPLLFRKAIFGLTGTPLLDSSNRVIELANLMGGTYVAGLSSHWRKLEKESCRNIFLHNYLEPKQSREVRKNIYSKCQDYITVACCRNKTGEEMDGVELAHHVRVVKMSKKEGTLYLKSQSGISSANQSYSIKPEDFDVSAGHDISKFLRQNAKLECRGKELVRIVNGILSRRGDEHTKVLVFADGRIGGGIAARHALEKGGLGCTHLDVDDSVEMKNKKIAWYQRGDATEEDRKRPRVLVLHFEHAAGLNLQAECHDLILFTPLYVGEGGTTSDPVADASTEQQAIGRVFRPGQPSPTVNVYRIEIRGPDDEECLDGQLIRRNTDEETIAMTINAGDE